MKFSSILLLSLGLVSGAAMAGGTTEAGVGGALGGVLGSVVGQQLGGNTGSTIGAALGGAGGSAVGADKRSRGEAAIGGALGAAVAKPPLVAHWAQPAVTSWAAASAAAPAH